MVLINNLLSNVKKKNAPPFPPSGPVKELIYSWLAIGSKDLE